MTTEPTTPSDSNTFDHIKAPNWSAGGVGQASAPVAQSFRDFYLSDELYEALDAVGYSTPTPVQAACTPLILAGIDLIVQAQTGTGKTAAFAIPSLEMLEPGTCKVEVLVLAPTRELAKQVGGEFERLGINKKIPVACVYGGTGFQEQLEALKTAQVVCATPGRLLDLLKRKAMTLKHLKFFILDEADEMLNMGFEEELTAIVERLPPIRQSLLFSATVTEEIKRLSGGMLSFPEFVSLSSDQVAAEQVHHAYYLVTGMGRLWDLTRIVEIEAPENAIVFCNTREDSFLVANFLRKQGYKAEVLNGDLPQRDREATLAKLKANQIQFLVATDVAARGIDISDLSHVLNYTLPESPETYIHRTGRTGRAGKQGKAVSLISPREIGTYYILRRVYKLVLEELEMPSTETLVVLREQRAFDDVLSRLETEATSSEGHLDLADRILGLDDARVHVARLLSLFASGEAAPQSGGVDEAALRARPAGAKRTNGTPRKAVAIPAPTPEPEAAPAAPEAPAEAAPEAAEAPREATAATGEEEAPRRRRRRRRRRSSEGEVEPEGEAVEAAAAPAARAEAAEAAPAEPTEKRRRRRRRRRSSEDEVEATPVEEAAQAAPEAPVEAAPAATEEPPPRRRRRRRRSVSDPLPEEVEAVPVPAAEPAPEVEAAPEVKAKPAPKAKAKPKAKPKAKATPKAKPAPKAKAKPKAKPRAKAAAVPKEMELIRINIGKNRFDTESAVVDVLCEMAGMEPGDFGDVTLKPRSSHVHARSDMVGDIIEAVHGQNYNGLTIKVVRSKR